MLRKGLVCIWILCGWTGNAFGQNRNALSENYYQLIDVPKSPEKWDAWRSELCTWKDTTPTPPNYKGNNYQKSIYKWVFSAYSTYFLMANETTLYDKNGAYAIKTCLKKNEANYDGVDVVVLWLTYPQLGFDNRTQYLFYRNLPGGVAGLKQLCNELNQLEKKLMIAYNPWDNIARNQGKTDEDKRLDLLTGTGADGVYLDTISTVEGFFQKMQKVNAGAVFQSEKPIRPEVLNQVHQSWLEVGWNEKYKNLEFGELPLLVRNRWLEQRHMIYRLSRFSQEQSTLIQNAWINGCGIVIWGNVFGTVNEVNLRDRSLLRAMLPIQRRYTQFFTEGTWTPLFPMQLNRLFASRWQLGKSTLWTIANRQEQWTTGKLFELDYVVGVRYFDLITRKEIRPSRANGKASLHTEFGPKAIGCILSVAESDVTNDFLVFLKKQADTHKRADYNTPFHLPKPRQMPVGATQPYAKSKLPKCMVPIPVSPDSVCITFSFRQRECSFYPIGHFVDYSYRQARNEITTGEVTVKLSPFSMYKTVVTNAQFAQFLKASWYQTTNGGSKMSRLGFGSHWALVNRVPRKAN